MAKSRRVPFRSTRVSWRDHERFGPVRDGWLLLSPESDLRAEGVEIRLRFESDEDGRPVWTGLLLTAQPGYQLDTKLPRDLKLGLISRHGALAAYLSDKQMRQLPLPPRPMGRPKKGGGDDDQHHWTRIASDYRKVKQAHPERPISELAALWRIDRTNAGRRVKRARELGYLDASE